MKDMWWNSGGFADVANHSFVHETIREHKLDFIVSMETWRSNLLKKLLFFVIYPEDSLHVVLSTSS
jgi:hypothetical protein